MKKILILGISGAGKSTLAKLLGEKLKLPVYYLDLLFWKPGWQMPEATEWEIQLNSLASKESWIIDGNYMSTYPILMPIADLIIILDFSRTLALYRIIKRVFSVRLGLVKMDSAPKGCQQKIDKEFLAYIWNFPQNRRPAIYQALQQFVKTKNVRILRNPRDVKLFINNFSAEQSKNLNHL